MKYEKVRPHGRILSWMFVKDIHCMAVKREHGIQYFRSLLCILTLPFYDVAALTKLNLINQSNEEGAKLFACKLRIERRKSCKDELYKPQFPFPMHEQIKYTLDPATNTACYKLVYQPVKVMDKIPLMPMKQDFLGNMALWCYNSDTHEAVIVFKNDEENIRMLDPMWIVNMSAADIDKLIRHDIFYEDKTPIKLFYFNASLVFASIAEFTLEARGPKQITRNEDQRPRNSQRGVCWRRFCVCRLFMLRLVPRRTIFVGFLIHETCSSSVASLSLV
ncbi:hypothetical protein Hanom_Chr13g01185911 [Helianthus anomalus]